MKYCQSDIGCKKTQFGEIKYCTSKLRTFFMIPSYLTQREGTYDNFQQTVSNSKARNLKISSAIVGLSFTVTFVCIILKFMQFIKKNSYCKLKGFIHLQNYS